VSSNEIPLQTDFPAEEFQARRARVLSHIGKDAVLLMQGVGTTPGFSMPRQKNEFYYLCGVETPHAYLLVDGRTEKTTLFLPPRNPRLEAAEGKLLSAEDVDFARARCGVDDLRSNHEMTGDWLRLEGRLPKTIFTLLSPAEGNTEPRHELNYANSTTAGDFWDGRLSKEAHFAGLLKSRYPQCGVEDITPCLDDLRSVKSRREIDLLRRASRIGGLALIEAMRSSRPGVREYELGAVARYVYLAHGARLDGYRPIIASGTENISNVHYYRNSGELRDGDLVLFDYAPEVGYYSSDVTRMWPASGKFLPWQRELLQFVLEYRDEIFKRTKPGRRTAEIREEVKAAMEPGLAGRFSKDIYRAGAQKLLDTGGGVFSHPIGMAVHDDGPYSDGPLKPGHVFTLDPQLWVPEERLYVRYEDPVAITEDGIENMTGFLPSELDDIEREVQRGGGLLQAFPPA